MSPRHSSTKTTDTTSQTSLQLCNDNMMEDLRNAKDTVATFADYIERLRPDEPRSKSAELLRSISSPTVKRHGSNNSSDSSSRKNSPKWIINRRVGKDWADSPSGTLWQQISHTLEEVAAEFQGVNATALNEFISAGEILDLGADFVRYYRRERLAGEKPNWAAEDLFFDLQSVKQGDARASRWTKARAEKRADWDLADHIARFVLLADAFRMAAERDDWNAWSGDFATNINFYLCVLRCFTLRDEKQRAAARERERGRDRDLVQEKEKRHSRASSYRFSRSSKAEST
ncbi:hypothetical protein F5Y13DRAFT_164057 [Hypoxylon sp. FL1857]|nr:hypothetical protein F5Y13DRAFT_164057 [Hypoxylon sp. FL1857]